MPSSRSLEDGGATLLSRRQLNLGIDTIDSACSKPVVKVRMRFPNVLHNRDSFHYTRADGSNRSDFNSRNRTFNDLAGGKAERRRIDADAGSGTPLL